MSVVDSFMIIEKTALELLVMKKFTEAVGMYWQLCGIKWFRVFFLTVLRWDVSNLSWMALVKSIKSMPMRGHDKLRVRRQPTVKSPRENLEKIQIRLWEKRLTPMELLGNQVTILVSTWRHIQGFDERQRESERKLSSNTLEGNCSPFTMWFSCHSSSSCHFPLCPFLKYFVHFQFYIWHFLTGLSESVSEPLQQLTQAIQKVDYGPWPVLFGSK